jgi:KH domain
VTDDSAFKKQVRALMAETGEKYTVARRKVISEHDPVQAPVTLRVHLASHVDLEVTAQTARAYTAADEQGRREMANRLLADHIEVAGLEEAQVAAGSKIVDLRVEAEAAEDTAIHAAVQRGIDRAVGVSAVEVGRTAGQLRVSIRAVRPILLAGRLGAEADRLRAELEELTGRRVQLDIGEERGPT